MQYNVGQVDFEEYTSVHEKLIVLIYFLHLCQFLELVFELIAVGFKFVSILKLSAIVFYISPLLFYNFGHYDFLFHKTWDDRLILPVKH